MPSSEQEALSLSEYQRGVSAWNFDIEDLKAQASLIRDDEPPEIKEDDDSARNIEVEKDSSSRNHLGKSPSPNENSSRERIFATTVNSDGKGPITNEAFDFDFSDADVEMRADGYENNRRENDSLPSTSKQDSESNHWTSDVGQRQQTSGRNNNSSTAERGHGFERDAAVQMMSGKQRSDRKTANLSGPLSLPTRASANSLSAPIRSSGGYVDSLGNKSKQNVVEIKGRFSVTSENVDLAKVQEVPISSLSCRSPQGSLLRKSASVGDWLVNAKPMCNSNQLKELCNSSVSSSILIPHLENLVQQTMLQQDMIMKLLSSLQQNEKGDGAQPGLSSQVRTLESDKGADAVHSEKERSLLVKISELQSRMITLTDELIAAKLKHVQLQQELNALYCREEIEDIRDEDNEET
uniref:Protein kinase superfamily protein n=1 Tax=Arundo donax TaxID=35708 RepID=A0A0A9CFU8_ARUDO